MIDEQDIQLLEQPRQPPRCIDVGPAGLARAGRVVVRQNDPLGADGKGSLDEAATTHRYGFYAAGADWLVRDVCPVALEIGRVDPLGGCRAQQATHVVEEHRVRRRYSLTHDRLAGGQVRQPSGRVDLA